MRDGSLVFGSGGGIRLKDVEPSLRWLWNSAAEQSPEGVRLTRVVLLNIIALCLSEESATQAAQCIGGVAADHPSRSVLVWNCGAEPSASLEVRVSVACQLMGRTGHQVCCEQVFVDARGAPLEKVAGAILPLTLPDVPLALWLPDGVDPCSDELRRFASVADRLLIDSRRQRDPGACFRKALEWHETGTPVVVDLAWLQLAGCRQAVARHFDPPRFREKLPGVCRVEVACGDAGQGSAPPADALLLAGWIAARLRWRDLAAAGPEGSFEAAGSKTLLLTRERGEGCHGVRRVSIVTDDGWSFVTELGPSPAEATLTVLLEGAEVSRDTVRIPDFSRTELLCGALEIARRDPLYAEACAAASALAPGGRRSA